MSVTRRRAAFGLGAGILAAACVGQADEAAAADLTPPQTEGPFFPRDTNVERDLDLTRLAGRSGRAAGQIIEVRGRVLDADGRPIQGAQLDMWQANAAGRYDHPGDNQNAAPLDPNFQSYARLTTGADGAYRLISVRPGGYDSPIGHRTPHLHWKARAGARALTTQMYFPGEAANAEDELYRALANPMLAVAQAADATDEGALAFEWNIVLPA
ncbi:MAG: protocatechuate 3,4-dioxygenase [Hyphomonadaceae bacterium]